MARLLKSTMRLRPDRIIVGEVRDGAALTLLKAWNTGHPGGVTTDPFQQRHVGASPP
jgi:type IV secretion system protein VirB11